MKNKFLGFSDFKDTELEKVWNLKNTLYIFDTSVLLNLYSYAEDTREDFFNLIERNILQLVWIPYHVGLEYQRKRLTTIKKEKRNFKEIETHLLKIESLIETEIKNNLKLNQRFPNLEKATEGLQNNIKKEIEKYKKVIEEQNKKQPDINSGDKIRKRLEKIFHNKIGDKPNEQENLNNIYKDGKNRYENKTPPGYMDKKEKEKLPIFTYSNLEYIPMYGDLIIWYQIIEKAKEDNIQSVILISDEIKEDWKYTLDSINCKKVSVRAELKEEIFIKAKIKNFTMLSTPEFMEFINKMDTIKVNINSISEVQNTFNNKLNKIINSHSNEPINYLREEYEMRKREEYEMRKREEYEMRKREEYEMRKREEYEMRKREEYELMQRELEMENIKKYELMQRELEIGNIEKYKLMQRELEMENIKIYELMQRELERRKRNQ